MSNETGGSAFPFGNPTHGGDNGMTLQDYFAAKVLQGVMVNATGLSDHEALSFVAEQCYRVADAMLQAKKKQAEKMQECVKKAVETERSIHRERVKFTAERWRIECKSQVELEREACITELERNADKPLDEIISAIRARGNNE